MFFLQWEVADSATLHRWHVAQGVALNDEMMKTFKDKVVGFSDTNGGNRIVIYPVKEKIILGIDPGTTIMGYGVLRVTGVRPELLTMVSSTCVSMQIIT